MRVGALDAAVHDALCTGYRRVGMVIIHLAIHPDAGLVFVIEANGLIKPQGFDRMQRSRHRSSLADAPDCLPPGVCSTPHE